MTRWRWIGVAVLAMVVAHWWIPAYALVAIFALLALGEDCRDHREPRRRWKDSHRV